MIVILIIACLLLLAYPLDPIRLPKLDEHEKTALLWRLLNRTLIKIENQYVLVDGEDCFAYLSPGSRLDDTYVPAVRMNTGRVIHILNHRYLLEYIRAPARFISYKPAPTLAETLNRIRDKLL